MRVIRCSAVDTALSCGASLVPARAPFKPNSPEAIEGTAAHECMPKPITGEGPTVGNVAEKYHLDHEMLAGLVRRAMEAWEDLRQWYPEPRAEKYMAAELAEGVELRGHTDLMSVAGAAVLDWKFGWDPSPHRGQVRSYAYLLRDVHGMPERGYILGAEVWARKGVAELNRFTDADLDRLRDQLLEQLGHPNQYAPSYTTCRYCPRQLECPARAEWLRSGVSALVPIEQNAPITRQQIADLYDRSRQIRKALGHFDDLLKAAVAEGELSTSDGRTLSLEEHEQDSIRPSKAMRILREELRLTAAEADLCLSVTKGGLQKVLKHRAPPHKGAAYMRETMRRLKEVGAVERITQQRIKVS